MRESRIENHSIRAAKDCGVFTSKFRSASVRGVPDRLFVFKGRTVFVEFKAPGEEPEPLQRVMIRKMLDAGASVFVIDSKEQVDIFFWMLLAGTLPATNITTNENADEIPVSQILALTPEKPLFGHKSGKQQKTHWIAFLKHAPAP